MKTFSLKFRFAIVMSIGVLALVFGIGAISTHFAEDDLLATLSSQQLGLVTRVAEHLDEKLKLATDALVSTAATIPADAIASDEHFDAFFAQHPLLLQLFDDVLVVDRGGVIRADYPTLDGRIGLDIGDRGYIKRAFATGRPVVSEPLRGRATGEPLIGIATPIVDAGGNLVALMVGLMRPAGTNLVGTLSSARIGTTGYYTVVTTRPEPTWLAYPDPARVMKPVLRAPGSAMSTVLGATTPGVTVGRLDDGSTALVSYRPLTTTDWTVTAVLPGAEAFAAIDRARERTIEIAIVAALIVLPLVWLLAWRLLRPLSTLRRQVESIAADPWSSTVATAGRDEVGQVAHAFNAMLQGQRRSEALRLASDQDRRRLVAILESSQDFVAMTDVDGKVTYLNASGRLLRGLALDDDLSRTTLADHFTPWAIDKLRRVGVPAALRDGIWVGETAVMDATGREVPVDHTVIAHRNVEGELEFFSSLLHDTSAAKASTAAVRSSEARMLSIANALPVMVAFIDCEYRYRFVNSRYEDHFGFGQSLILGKSIDELIGEAAYRVYLPYLGRAASGETQVFEIESTAGLRPVHFVVKLIPQFDDRRVLTGFHFIHQDVTVHKTEQKRLSQLVRADALTGLLNRAGFDVAIDEAMQRSQHHGSSMALFYLDIDRFKSINDRHGHGVGDTLLRAFASRLVRAVRSADVVARLGGDEFVVIAEGLRNADDVCAIARKILRAMRPDFDAGVTMLSITASIGIAAYGGEPMEPDELVRRADEALYRAKNAGRDRYDLDDPSQPAMIASAVLGDALAYTSIF